MPAPALRGIETDTRTSIRARLVKSLRHAPSMMWLTDPAGAATFVNRQWLGFTGRRLKDELGESWLESVHPDDVGTLRERYRQTVRARLPFAQEFRVRRADGVYRWISDHGLPLYEEYGRFAGYVGMCVDITDRRDGSVEWQGDAQIALLRRLISHMNDGVLAESEDGQHAFVNRSFHRVFGLAEQTPEDGSASLRRLALSRLADAGHSAPADAPLRPGFPPGELRLNDGRILEQEYFAVRLEDRRVIHVRQFRDITTRKREEEELRTSRHRLRDFSAHLEQAREEERRELARALHDEVGQLLTGIRLEVAAAVERFMAAPTPATFPVVDRLQAAVGLVDLSIATVQRITTALRPPILDHLGLLPAIKWEAAVFERRTGIRCRVSAEPPVIETRQHVTVLYRILLEALTNVARHANAGTVWIRLRQRGGRLTMVVRDNGAGISESVLAGGTMGLIGMRERALAVGGEVRIARLRSGGTSVTATVPLSTAPHDTEPTATSDA